MEWKSISRETFNTGEVEDGMRDDFWKEAERMHDLERAGRSLTLYTDSMEARHRDDVPMVAADHLRQELLGHPKVRQNVHV